MKTKPNDDHLTVLRCWDCGGQGEFTNCWKCSRTGSVFWVNGYAYPYTPEGEKQARRDGRRA